MNKSSSDKRYTNKGHMTRVMALAATVTALTLSGCANMTETQKGTTKGAAIGAGVGAVVGAIAG